MRVALVSENAAGVERGRRHLYVAELAAGLTRLGEDVTLHTSGPPEPGEFAATLTEAWRRRPPDVVHAHGWTAGMAALLAVRGVRDRGGRGASMPLPVVQTFHGLDAAAASSREPLGGVPQRVHIERLVGRRADRVLATSSAEADALVAMRVPRSRVTVVPYGVDCELFTPLPPGVGRGRRTFRVLAVGRPTPGSGLGDVIAAVAKVPNAELLVVGGPPTAELDGDPGVGRLRGYAERTGLCGRLRLTGYLPRAELASIMRRADVVVCMPWRDSSGLVALEAMASGTAVVASDVGGLRDVVVHGVTGELVRPRRPERLAATLARLAADDVSREKYGTAGRDRALSRYQWDRIVAETVRAYAPRFSSAAADGQRAMNGSA